MIALRAEDGLPVVLLPKQFRGYYWYDTDGTKVSANKKTAITVSSPMLTLDDAWEAAEKAGIADNKTQKQVSDSLAELKCTRVVKRIVCQLSGNVTGYSYWTAAKLQSREAMTRL